MDIGLKVVLICAGFMVICVVLGMTPLFDGKKHFPLDFPGIL